MSDHLITGYALFCSGLALLMAVTQFALRRRDAVNYVLAALLVCLSSFLSRIAIFHEWGSAPGAIAYLFHIPLTYAIGPLLLTYYRMLVQDRPRWERSMAVHFFLPALLAIADPALLLVKSLDNRTAVIGALFAPDPAAPAIAIRAVFFGAAVYSSVYMLAILRGALSLYRLSEMDTLKRSLAVVMLLSLAGGAIFMAGLVTGSVAFGKAGTLVVGTVIIAAYLMGQRYTELFQSLPRDIRQKRYERSQLKSLDIGIMQRRLAELMESEKLYSDENITLPALAGKLVVTPHQLSEFLNERLSVNFSTFINRYRIDEAKQLLAADPDLTILQIAFSVGFNSKSAFNAAFLKFTGTTPIAFRRNSGTDDPDL